MNTSPFEASDIALDAEIQAQLCAYNAAFDELGLRFRWDARTLASLAAIDGEQERIATYIETHHAHLLKAYSAEFLSRAILEKKSARYPACLLIRVAGASQSDRTLPQQAATRWGERVSFEIELPGLAGV